MVQVNTEQEWQKLQARVESMFTRFTGIGDKSLQIEDKSEDRIQLLEMPAKYRKKMTEGSIE